MNARKLLCAALTPLLACAIATAQDQGSWRASNESAKSITGDILLYNQKIAINFAAFTIAQIRALKPGEASAIFDVPADSATGTGNLYRLSIPPSRKFLHHNTLCGSEETQWMVTYAAGRDLQVAFFSGASMPVLTPEATMNATNLCGIFSYVR